MSRLKNAGNRALNNRLRYNYVQSTSADQNLRTIQNTFLNSRSTEKLPQRI